MPSTDSLKGTIEANTIAIKALSKEAENVYETQKQVDEAIQREFCDLLVKNCVIPDEITSRNLVTHISSSLIRLKWNDFKNHGYTTTHDIYYRSPESWDNQGTDNHSWEISCSSLKLYVDTTDESRNSRDHEGLFYTKFALEIRMFLTYHATAVIALHERLYENNKMGRNISDAIDKFERANTEAQSQITRNEMVKLFKPHGETSLKTNIGVDIPMFTTGSYHYKRNRSLQFEALHIVKETKKCFTVDFVHISKWKDEEGADKVSRWVSGTKRLTLDGLVSLAYSNKQEAEREAKRKLEKEEREAKRLAEQKQVA